MGRRFSIGCVALEITQRCNLDCNLCYLSENSESILDIPLQELFRRIDVIAAHYGPLTDVQVTGGDPTLRDPRELVEIVARIKLRGMRASLFTNGIRLKRQLLENLVDAGLTDVAFHVDLTQNRKGFATEGDLNAQRLAYIDRARGLPISVFFNTTIFAGNLHQIPDVVRFFTRHSDVVSLVSFQMAADTGRGTAGPTADESLTTDKAVRQIEKGLGTNLSFDTVQVGHIRCNKYGMALVAGERIFDLLDDKQYIRRMMQASTELKLDRNSRLKAVKDSLLWLLRHPDLWFATIVWSARKLKICSGALLRSRGRVSKLSIFVHNFMDACALESERIQACSFMVATADGPVSMCLHNARRDEFLFRPIELVDPDSVATCQRADNGSAYWHPVTGNTHTGKPEVMPTPPHPKVAKGKTRVRLKINGERKVSRLER